jgi:putative MATE family efflux protein
MILPKSDPRAIILMAQYVSIFALSLPAFFVIQALAGSLRGIGDTKSPMVLSGIQIMLHMCLNFLLVFPSRHVLGVQMPGAGWGLAGAASALTISTCVSAIGYVLWVRNTPLRNVWSARLPSLDWATRILKIAIPAAVTSTLRVLSMTTFTLVLAMTASGSVAIAAMSTGFTIESVMYMPSFGLAAAAGALVGQSLGANRPDRAERLGWIAAHHAALVTAALAIPLMIWARPVASLLLENKPDMIAQSALLLRYLCATEVMFAYAMVANGAMQGAGDTVRPMWISILSLWLIRVPMAFLVVLPAGQQLFGGVSLPVGLGLGSAGAWLTLSFSQGIQGVLALVLYGQGRWKTQRV